MAGDLDIVFSCADHRRSPLAVVPYAPIELATLAAIVVLAVVRVRAWAVRAGWGGARRLALASGALGLWIVLLPVVWFTGLPLVALGFAVALVWLARWVQRSGVAQPTVVTAP